jgi:hypothetical protein
MLIIGITLNSKYALKINTRNTMITQRSSRKEKLKFLQELKAGRASLKEALQPITGIIFMDEGEVFAETNYNGKTTARHTIIFKDYSKMNLNYNGDKTST